MEYTHYGYRHAVGAYFQMPTSDARRLLPSNLQPVEVQHTRSILALTCFDFVESEVGAYHEVVLAVVVPPLVEPGKPLPKAAFFPFIVGTTTEASRLHAIERWHLPHYMSDLEIEMHEVGNRMDVYVRDNGAPVLDLSVTKHDFQPARNLYNSFMVDGNRKFKANIYMEAPHSEHEEEQGRLTLYEHPMTEGLTLDDIDIYPFREQWYLKGRQTFEPLIEL